MRHHHQRHWVSRGTYKSSSSVPLVISSLYIYPWHPPGSTMMRSPTFGSLSASATERIFCVRQCTYLDSALSKVNKRRVSLHHSLVLRVLRLGDERRGVAHRHPRWHSCATRTKTQRRPAKVPGNVGNRTLHTQASDPRCARRWHAAQRATQSPLQHRHGASGEGASATGGGPRGTRDLALAAACSFSGRAKNEGQVRESAPGAGGRPLLSPQSHNHVY